MLEEACLIQTLSECGHEFLAVSERPAAQNSDHRHRRLLRARRERPRSGAAEQRYELAAFHSITSSAMESSDGGTVRTSILAVSALMTSSNFVDFMAGRAAGFTPLRLRP